MYRKRSIQKWKYGKRFIRKPKIRNKFDTENGNTGNFEYAFSSLKSDPQYVYSCTEAQLAANAVYDGLTYGHFVQAVT